MDDELLRTQFKKAIARAVRDPAKALDTHIVVRGMRWQTDVEGAPCEVFAAFRVQCATKDEPPKFFGCCEVSTRVVGAKSPLAEGMDFFAGAESEADPVKLFEAALANATHKMARHRRFGAELARAESEILARNGDQPAQRAPRARL